MNSRISRYAFPAIVLLCGTFAVAFSLDTSCCNSSSSSSQSESSVSVSSHSESSTSVAALGDDCASAPLVVTTVETTYSINVPVGQIKWVRWNVGPEVSLLLEIQLNAGAVTQYTNCLSPPTAGPGNPIQTGDKAGIFKLDATLGAITSLIVHRVP